MNRRLTMVVALTVALTLAGAAGARACRRVPAKTWKGTIAFSHVGGNGFASITEQWFQDNGCSWNGQHSFDGFDATVFSMARYGGLAATFTWSGDATAEPTVSGFFLDSRCQQILQGGFASDTPGKAQRLRIPRQAKWLEVDAQTVVPWPSNIVVKVRSPGKRCRRT